MTKHPILLHKGELTEPGVDVKAMTVIGLHKRVQLPHRDDHYMFIIQQKGNCLWELDFNEVALSGPSLCFVTPGQVHRYIDHKNTEGWLVFVDSELVPTAFREIFDTYLNSHQSVVVKKDDAFFNIVSLLEDTLHQSSIPLRNTLISSMVASLTGLIASKIILSRHAGNFLGGQKYNTVIRFKQLVNAKCKELKQVKAYASLLNITPLYLNEVVKEITGFPASHWIHQEILLEAKRLLFYSTLDIKEVAYELGYEDHAYFSRFFKKQVGLTASEFRAKNH
ncbi:helix-turn-helix domain-containing protein [Chitinophaga arvensicola]|uniref:AraC-type DNA-binding protein n=1 Tax=Chitinophaga arvensicola TaxID=29529 RepID=A0A1I0S9M4_9BACT|nr:helix-turn-helix domain-containing protein [Chitinophaga arvensicola]SEW52871.1 AraC-type DNA-binding protein [Chitinophaga arvensicola]